MKMTVADSEHLLEEWDSNKNERLPNEVTLGSNYSAHWICKKKQHEWKATVAHRASRGDGCPYCAGKYVLKGETDLQTVNPDLVQLWNHERNGELKPDQITGNSNRTVWWRCKKGHEWQAQVNSLAQYRSEKSGGCPYCAGKRPIKGETDLATLRPDLAAEWHPTLNGELTPDQVMGKSGKKVWWKCAKGHEWDATIASRSAGGNDCPFCAGKRAIRGENDLLSLNPQLAAEWHPTLNGILTPDQVTSMSGRKVWWRCARGHEWKAAICDRGGRNQKCPYCSGRRAISGETDLETLRPELAAEWHPEKNLPLMPSQVTVCATNKVTWICAKGHEWTTHVHNRSRGRGCPYCDGRRVLPGENDLRTLEPEFLKEWDYTKNYLEGIDPSQLTLHSNKRVWWKCVKAGHSWKTSVNHRSKGDGCPICSKKGRKKKKLIY